MSSKYLKHIVNNFIMCESWIKKSIWNIGFKNPSSPGCDSAGRSTRNSATARLKHPFSGSGVAALARIFCKTATQKYFYANRLCYRGNYLQYSEMCCRWLNYKLHWVKYAWRGFWETHQTLCLSVHKYNCVRITAVDINVQPPHTLFT